MGHGEAPHKPRAKLRKAATGGRAPAGARGEQPPKAAGLPLHQKRGDYLPFVFIAMVGVIARAAGRVRPVKPTAAGARRAIAIQRAAPTTLPRRGIRRAHAASWRLGRGNAEAAYVFYTRAGRVVREMFLIV